jgi:hypothetical protein
LHLIFELKYFLFFKTNYDRIRNASKKENIMRYHQDSNSDELEDFDEEKNQRPKKKETKEYSETIKRGV